MKIILEPNAPYDFELSSSFLFGEKPLPCRMKDKRLLRAFTIGNRLIPAMIISVGTVEDPKLEVTTVDIDARERTELKQRISNLLNLDWDLKALYQFMDSDPILTDIKGQLYGFIPPRMSDTVFEGIIKAIIQQQISLRVANHMTAKIVERLGDSLVFENETFFEFPAPITLARSSLEQIRKCGLSLRKAEYCRDFSKAVVGGFDPESLKSLEPHQIIEKLTKFRGIGRWTAELVMIACMGIGQTPAGDLGMRKAVSWYYFNGELQSEEVVRKFMNKWRGVKGIAVYLLYSYRMK